MILPSFAFLSRIVIEMDVPEEVLCARVAVTIGKMAIKSRMIMQRNCLSSTFFAFLHVKPKLRWRKVLDLTRAEYFIASLFKFIIFRVPMSTSDSISEPTFPLVSTSFARPGLAKLFIFYIYLLGLSLLIFLYLRVAQQNFGKIKKDLFWRSG